MGSNDIALLYFSRAVCRSPAFKAALPSPFRVSAASLAEICGSEVVEVARGLLTDTSSSLVSAIFVRYSKVHVHRNNDRERKALCNDNNRSDHNRATKTTTYICKKQYS